MRRRAAALAGGAITAKLISRERLTPEEQAKLDEMEPQAVSELSEYERFVMLPELAFMAHIVACLVEHGPGGVRRVVRALQEIRAGSSRARAEVYEGFRLRQRGVSRDSHACRACAPRRGQENRGPADARGRQRSGLTRT